jgi:flagellar hook assembly protein FlgD
MGFSMAIVNDGSDCPRTSYVGYRVITQSRNGLNLTSTDLSSYKKVFFGGRTLIGTIYHLEKTNTAVQAADLNLQPGLFLAQNSPNPFTSQTNIAYTLPAGSHQMRLGVYDTHGRPVKTLAHQKQEAGGYQVFWNGAATNGKLLPAGVYLCRLEAGNLVKTRKMVFSR